MIGDSPTPLVTYTDSGGGYGGTDLPYVQMDADLYADMIIARWPVDDVNELVAMRDKILVYEQPTAGSSAWLNRALFMEGYDYQGQGMTTHADVIAELMAPPPNSAENTRWLETQNHTVADLIAYLNTGGAWAVYSAHSGPSGWSGPPPLSTGDFASFTNLDMYPLGFGHSCSSNEWNNYPDVFGEAAVTTANKGFVSYWGGSASTYWDGDDWLERGFFDSMFDIDMSGNQIPLDRQYSQGAACYAGLTEVTLQGGDEQYYWYLYNLNGDPTLDPFTRQPIALDVGAPSVIPPAASTDFEVTVSDSVIGPVPLALVGVSQDGVLLGAGLTDATGTAIFPIEAPGAGSDVTVRVTAHNHLPTDATVIVAAGSDGVVTLDRSVYRCDSTVGIDVFDEDIAGHGTQSVTLSAQPSGGSTTVILTEVGGSVVRFTGTAVLGTNLVVAHGDTLTVSYYDQNTGGGSGATKTDTALLDCAGPAISGVELEATNGVGDGALHDRRAGHHGGALRNVAAAADGGLGQRAAHDPRDRHRGRGPVHRCTGSGSSRRTPSATSGWTPTAARTTRCRPWAGRCSCPSPSTRIRGGRSTTAATRTAGPSGSRPGEAGSTGRRTRPRATPGAAFTA